jgi:uncharacterized RDD family membrane protein YckC
MELYQEDRELVRNAPPGAPRPWRGYALSGWWRRVGATVLDAFIVVPLALAAGLALGVDVDRLWSESATASDRWLSTAGSFLVALLYFPAIMRATDGRTLGKMATRIRVVRTDERPMSFVRATWREVVVKQALALLPSFLWILALLDDLWPLWDRENRAVHDMLAGTRVVRSDIARDPAHTRIHGPGATASTS